jgi:streptogramin lyase
VLGLTVHEDAVWAISFQEESIAKIDPGSGAVVLTERLGSGAATVLSAGSQLWVAGNGMGSGSVWAGIRHPGYVGAVLQLDPSSGEVVADIGDVDIPARIAIGFGSVWVSDSGSSNVVRIAPA